MILVTSANVVQQPRRHAQLGGYVTRKARTISRLETPTMDGDVLAFAQVMTVIITSVTVLTGVFLGARVLWKMGSQPRQQRLPVMDESRLERIENAVDAIAIEVERISEAQRFSASLLADRLPARQSERVPELAQPAASKRANTPH